MGSAFARIGPDGSGSIGNDRFALAVARDGDRARVKRLALLSRADADLAVPSHAFGPCIIVNGTIFSPAHGNLRCAGIHADVTGVELRVSYTSSTGLEVTQHLTPSPDQPVWRSWIDVKNPGSVSVDGLTRFDAVNLCIETGEGEPEAAYVLGWMEGPRADAPGHHSLPWKYGGWIPKFLYGEGFNIPAQPPGGWAAPVFRLVQERLTRLPLRSGKRSTYENHPWVVVRDPRKQAGFFLGFEWSGTWKMDAEHHPLEGRVTVFATSDANSHTIAPGATLISPPAFVGLFEGDWDDAFNASRAYADLEIIPRIRHPWPTTLHGYVFHLLPEKRGDDHIRREIAAAAAAGYETTYVEASWWGASVPLTGDFSVGLGDFTDHRSKFPMGLKAMSQYVHEHGMKFGLWFEFERVDIRTANRGLIPWKPEWLVHQKGQPYRSWCQHVYLLCLGVPEAAEWALRNLLWAIREYDVDYVMIDSNEWGVCDDPSHGHGAGDGEWAQTHGFYHVMRGLREAFPDLMVMSSSGGSQRGDFGVARWSNCMNSHDNYAPSAKQRRFQHGSGCMYPSSYLPSAFADSIEQPDAEGFLVAQPAPKGFLLDAERFEWRFLNRLLGFCQAGMEISALPAYQLDIVKRGLAFARRIRPSTHGDRYVLEGPRLLMEPEYRETDNWECYQNCSRDGSQVVVHCFRCLSSEHCFTARLRGLAPGARYQAEFWRDRPALSFTGAELMDRGYTFDLPRQRCADIMVLSRL